MSTACAVSSGATPLIAACQRKLVQVVTQMISLGADVHATDARGSSALMYAAQNRLESVTEALLAAGADARATDRQGRDALRFATRGRGGEAVAAILEAHMGGHLRASGNSTCTRANQPGPDPNVGM